MKKCVGSEYRWLNVCVALLVKHWHHENEPLFPVRVLINFLLIVGFSLGLTPKFCAVLAKSDTVNDPRFKHSLKHLVLNQEIVQY